MRAPHEYFDPSGKIGHNIGNVKLEAPDLARHAKTTGRSPSAGVEVVFKPTAGLPELKLHWK